MLVVVSISLGRTTPATLLKACVDRDLRFKMQMTYSTTPSSFPPIRDLCVVDVLTMVGSLLASYPACLAVLYKIRTTTVTTPCFRNVLTTIFVHSVEKLLKLIFPILTYVRL
mgnify:CR=1 FL=1